MKYTTFLLFLFFSLHASLYSKAQSPKLISSKEKSVFQIKLFDEYGIDDGRGTGFFVQKNGTALTALHVLDEAKYAYIMDNEGKYFRINEVTRVCNDCDLVEFKIATPQHEMPIISVGNTIPPKGTLLFSIGNPEGFNNSFATGIVSAVRDEDGIKTIQTTTPISHGSSGSPLMNMKGQAIGVVSYGYSEAQNLNFAYSLECMTKMNHAENSLLTEYLTKDIRFVNQMCPADPSLILRSIELTDTATILNFSFTNLSIIFGDGAYIYSNTSDTLQSMYLQDPMTKQRWYIMHSTLATSPDEAPTMKMGQTRLFKMYFPPIGDLRTIDIGESMPGGNWSFKNIIIPDKSDFDLEKNLKQTEPLYDDLMGLLHDGQFSDALNEVQKLAKKGKGNIRTYMAAAIAAFAKEDFETALVNTKQVLEKKSDMTMSHANLAQIYIKQNNNEDAIQELDDAIALNDNYREFYTMRGDLYYAMENWSKAIDNYDVYVSLISSPPANVYFQRGMARIKKNDTCGCEDLEKAKNNADSDREWDKINTEIKKHCKDYKQ